MKKTIKNHKAVRLALKGETLTRLGLAKVTGGGAQSTTITGGTMVVDYCLSSHCPKPH